MGLSGALMPGPVMTVTMAHVHRRGALTGPLVASGHALVEAILVAALALGAGGLLLLSWVNGLTAVIGAVVLMWMAWGMFKESRTNNTDQTATTSALKTGPVLSGILTSISNPYWFLWWSTVGVGYFAVAKVWGIWGIITFFIGHILADYAWLTLLSTALARGSRLIGSKVYNFLLRGLALFLAFLATGFFIYGSRTIIALF
ncbi:MAG TPA: LysE family transporter [Firmicutes bacterium]|nr:LysE family transporter [Bacillota bacterium]